MFGGHHVGVVVDAVHQDSGKQEIREHDDAPVAQLDRVLQPRFHQRKGHAGIDRLAPAETEAFPQHARDLGHVGVGVRVRRAAPDRDQHGLVPRDMSVVCIRASQCPLDPFARGADHLQVDAQLAAVDYFDALVL